MAITIERDGKTYALNLERIGAPQTEAISRPAGAETVELSGAAARTKREQVLKLLSLYDLVLVIDRSGSMNTEDCPSGLSRWQWCQQQAKDLVASLKPYIKSGLSIITFSDSFDAFDHVNIDTIDTVFENVDPGGSTDLVDPLKYEFSKYFNGPHNKPLLLAVITDGLPNQPSRDPRLLQDVLIDATKHMDNSRQVAVTFLQIGDFAGQRQLVDLELNLVANGGRFDIIDVKTFAELKLSGLPEAMVEAVLPGENRKTAQSGALPPPPKPGSKARPQSASASALDQSLLQMELERHRLEKQLLNSK